MCAVVFTATKAVKRIHQNILKHFLVAVLNHALKFWSLVCCARQCSVNVLSNYFAKELSLGSLVLIEKSINKDDILFHKETDNLVVYRVKDPEMRIIADQQELDDMPW